MRIMAKPEGLKLHLLRISRKMTMDDIAKLSNLSRLSIRKIEGGETVTTLTAFKLANAYNVEMQEYFNLIDK